MTVKKASRKSTAAEVGSPSITASAKESSSSRAKGSASSHATGSAGTPPRGGAVRKQVLVNPTYLRGAMAVLGTNNMSLTVNVALERLAEDAAILSGVDAAMGIIPDFPYLDR